VIGYTGGTTGKPKGVTHIQSGLGLNLLAHVVCGDVRSDEVMALTTPLPHSAGYHLHACLLQGGCAVLARKFDPENFVRIARDFGATWTFAVPTMIYRLLDHLQAAPGGLPNLRTIVYGAAPMSVERLEQGLAAFGPVFIQIYGQTECPNFITTLSKNDHLDPGLLASCGRPVPFLHLEVLSPDGEPAAPGVVGEIVVRSPYNLVGYYQNPSATGEALRDGALHTGDLALRDERGFIFLVDRAKDMIITGGMNVYSVEVERALRAHASIGDAAVIGLPDADWGERVVAVVTSRSPVDASELREALRKQISAYKVPKEIVSIPSMPLTPYGKIDKKQLRATLSARRST
jgi:fatty-acyl-CoA synthase/long-chain acyl-CoA synthetase